MDLSPGTEWVPSKVLYQLSIQYKRSKDAREIHSHLDPVQIASISMLLLCIGRDNDVVEVGVEVVTNFFGFEISALPSSSWSLSLLMGQDLEGCSGMCGNSRHTIKHNGNSLSSFHCYVDHRVYKCRQPCCYLCNSV